MKIVKCITLSISLFLSANSFPSEVGLLAVVTSWPGCIVGTVASCCCFRMCIKRRNRRKRQEEIRLEDAKNRQEEIELRQQRVAEQEARIVAEYEVRVVAEQEARERRDRIRRKYEDRDWFTKFGEHVLGVIKYDHSTGEWKETGKKWPDPPRSMHMVQSQQINGVTGRPEIVRRLQ